MRRPLLPWLSLSLLAAALAHPARADEGMWLFNQPPRELLHKKYGFDLTDAWLERAQKAAVRFNSGGSGSFVSPDGLVVTNHHIGADALQKLSTREKNYYRDGFYARSRAEELKCPDLELNQLEAVEDVTERVRAAVPADLGPAEAAAARKAVLSRIELEATKATGLRSNVITLYQGGQYHLYRYRKFTDVRLVMAPEHQVAFFGGDTDNFEYPRYNLDVCFFRVYENGKPLRPKHWFPWNTTGVKEGDLVFVVGNPGSTNRLETLARLTHRRDLTLPYTLNRLRHLEALLQQFGARGPEYARQAADDLFSVANARKALTGQYLGLLTPAVLREKSRQEGELRGWVKEDAGRQEKYGSAWEAIARAQGRLEGFEREYYLLERGDAFGTELFRIARHLVRLAAERAKPNEQRLAEYRDSALDSLKLQLFSPAPVHPELEMTKLAGTLAFQAEILGGDHPFVRRSLGGRSPADRAAQLVGGSKLADVAERKRLAEGGQAAVDASADPLVRFAADVDPAARELRQRYENEVEEPEQQAYARIARARFERYGASVPPDATFTLRLAFGTVQGYEEDGKPVPFATTLAGLYERAAAQDHRPPFDLPPRWAKLKGQLDLTTPFNFAATSDTIGGNSGSPVINRAGELVGVNFDRNRHGLVRNYVYTDHQARHVSVHGLAVLEALRQVYDAGPLLHELLRRK